MKTPAAKEMEDQLSILLVEDNLVDALMMKHLLEHSRTPKYEVVHVEDMARAVQMIPTRRFDCVILDLMLPDSQGVQSVQKLQELAPKLPIIVLTGVNDETLSLQCL